MMDDDVLLCVRYLFEESPISYTRLALERYHAALSTMKRKVLVGQISGARYHQTEQLMRAEALREGLTAYDYERMVDSVERSVDYTRLRIHFATFD
jgi:hypothetical protein